MKTKVSLLSIFVAFSLVACQKDNDGMLKLIIEGMNGDSKMVVDGNVSYWATGDEVRINDATSIINISTSSGTATSTVGVSNAEVYYGVYPAEIYSSNNGASYTLDLPATYTYATTTRQDHTYQNLQAPMVGYTTNSNMQFKHVTAAIGVQVINHYGFTIEVDSIIVTSNLYKLCGETAVTLGETIIVSASETEDASLRSVKMICGSSLHVLAGDTATVQVPVLPVGGSNKFTIKICVHKVDQPVVKKDFVKTQGSSHSLLRAKIGYAPAVFGGLFSVDSDRKVVISQGNLQYNKTTGEWSFLDSQYGTIEQNAINVGVDYANADVVSLFGWGTSGWDNGNAYYLPTNTAFSGSSSSATGYGYGPTDGSSYAYSLTGVYQNADWGVYNAIENGGDVAGRWHTPSSSDFSWIFVSRTRISSRVNGTSNARYTFGIVYGMKGIIIFPDDFVEPTLTQGSIWGPINNKSAFSTNIHTTDWYLLEAEGAVFLPAAGGHSPTGAVSDVNRYGYYWYSDYYSSDIGKANSFMFNSSSWTVRYTDRSRYMGCAVRLVRDVQ